MYLESKFDYQLTLHISKKYTRIFGLFCIISFVMCATYTVSYRLTCANKENYAYSCVLQQKFLSILVFNTPLGRINNAEIEHIRHRNARRHRDYYQFHLILVNGKIFPLQIRTYYASDALRLVSEINHYIHYQQQESFTFPYARGQQFKIFFFFILSLLFLVLGLISICKRNLRLTFDKNKNWIKIRPANFFIATKTVPLTLVKEIISTRKAGVEFIAIILHDNSSINIKDNWNNSVHENEYVVSKINQFLYGKGTLKY